MRHHRLWAVLIVTVVAGCQQLLGLDPGNQSSSGPSGTGAGSIGIGGGTSTSSTNGGGTTTSTTATVTSTSSASTSAATTTTTGATTTTGTGSTGAGGNSCNSPWPVPISAPNMIDNLEHSGDSIPTTGGRCGTWFTYNDGTGPAQTPPSTMVAPAMPGFCSNFAMHTTGGPFTSYGGGIGFDLNSCAAGARKIYSAPTTSKGIAFWAKSTTAADATLPIYLLVLEPATVAAGGSGGGTCTPTDAGGLCGDSHRFQVPLTTDWQEYNVLFTDLVQAGWGITVPFDSTQILAMQFNVPIGQAFDFWVDDIGFY
jgi:hypothetical protein